MNTEERRSLEDEDVRCVEEELLIVAVVQAGGGVRTFGREWARMGLEIDGEAATLADIFCDDDLPRARAALQRLERDAVVAFDARLRADGSGERATWLRFRATSEGTDGDVRLVGLDITDLKRALVRSAREVELLEATVERAQAGIAITDEHGIYVTANAWYRHKTGAGGRDLRGASYLESVPPEHHPFALEVQRGFFAGEPEPVREWGVTDTSGAVAELRVESVMIRTADGTPYKLSTLTDITAERRRDARLHLFGKLLESVPFVLWALDKDGRFTHAEGKGLAAFGRGQGEWIGRDAVEAWKGTPAYDNMKRALAGEDFKASFTVPGPIDYDAWYVPLRAAGGEPDGMIALALDVTKDRAIEGDLREKLETVQKQRATIDLFVRALRSAPVILWSIDMEGKTLISEGKGMELLGLESGKVSEISAFEAYRGTPIEPALRSALEGHEVAVLTEPAPGQFFDNWIMPVRTTEGGELCGAMGLSIHATERVKSERALREKIELIGRQSATIRELATPIINVWDEVLVLPVIGTVDSRRAADMMDALLSAVVREKASFAIVDLTGVEIVDTLTADHIIKLFKSARVLGVEGVLCGIQPAVAQTVIGLGVELGSIRTMRTLQTALRWCIGARDRQRSARAKTAAPAAD